MNANIETASPLMNAPVLEVGQTQHLNLGRIMSKHFPINNKDIPQDSAIDYNYKIATLNADDEVIDVMHIKGTQTKGADSITTKPQKGMNLKAIVDTIEGMNTPQAKAFGMQLLEAAVQDFETDEERVAWWASKGINWSKPTGALYKELRAATPTVKTGEVKIHPNA